MSQKVLDILAQQFGDAIVEAHSQHGDDTAVVDPARWKAIATFLRDDARCQMDMFTDLTAVDYLPLGREPRFEVVLHVRSLEKAHRFRLKTRLGDRHGGGLDLDSLADVWIGANWFERECYDMFGINFVGHPDLRRILMYEEFEGHPLRKDYSAGHAQPLVPYRDAENEKLPPFGPDEGMSFGRQTHERQPRGQWSTPVEAELEAEEEA